MRSWRKTTWAITIWTGLMGLWAISGLAAAGEVASECAAETYTEACEAGTALGGMIGISFLVFIWLAVLIPLSILWFATRNRGA